MQEHVEGALSEAVEDGRRLKNKLASATEEVEWCREQVTRQIVAEID